MEQEKRVKQQKKNMMGSGFKLNYSRRKAMAVIGGTLGAASIGGTSAAAQEEEDEEEDNETIVEVPEDDDLWSNPLNPINLPRHESSVRIASVGT